MTAVERAAPHLFQRQLWDNAIAECIRYQQMVYINLVEACNENSISTRPKEGIDLTPFLVEAIRKIRFETDDLVIRQSSTIKSVPLDCANNSSPLEFDQTSCGRQDVVVSSQSRHLTSSMLPPQQVEPQEYGHDILSLPFNVAPADKKLISQKETRQKALDAPPKHLSEQPLYGNFQEMTAFLFRAQQGHEDVLSIEMSRQQQPSWKNVEVEHFTGPHPSSLEPILWSPEEKSSKILKELVTGLFHSLSLRQREESICADANTALKKQSEVVKRLLKGNIQRSLLDIAAVEGLLRVTNDDIKLGLSWINQGSAILLNIEVRSDSVVSNSYLD